MRRTYYFLKRRVMRLVCLTGRHDYRFSVYNNKGGVGGCLWCRKSKNLFVRVEEL